MYEENPQVQQMRQNRQRLKMDSRRAMMEIKQYARMGNEQAFWNAHNVLARMREVAAQNRMIHLVQKIERTCASSRRVIASKFSNNLLRKAVQMYKIGNYDEIRAAGSNLQVVSKKYQYDNKRRYFKVCQFMKKIEIKAARHTK
jgi:hypothetical protein